MPAPSRQPSRDKLELSRLDNRAFLHTLMTEDIDLQSLLIYFMGELRLDAVDRVIEARVNLTIDGAPTLVVTINDYDRTLLRSGLLSNKLDLQIDGIWFRLVKVEKSSTSDDLDLTMELREIAVLRKYNSLKIAHRSKTTRAEFLLNLLQEPVEFDHIPYVIPDLHKVQPIEKSTQLPDYSAAVQGKTLGIPEDTGQQSSPSAFYGGGGYEGGATQRRVNASQQGLTVKGQPASPEQMSNANTVLSVGSSMQARRKVLVVSIMVAIQESTLINVDHGDVAGPDSRGLFQQRANWGSETDRMDQATSSRLFFNAAIKLDAAEPTVPYWTLANDVQGSAHPLAYQQWRAEAERFVAAFGIPGQDNGEAVAPFNGSAPGDAAGGDFIYYRGDPQDGGKKWKKEDSWSAMQRMAEEVDCRAFFAPSVTTGAKGMVFYFLRDDELYSSIPVAIIGEFTEGVEGLGFDYDQGKAMATVTLLARVGRWSVPPGSVVIMHDMGPVNGRFLVTAFDRSLFDTQAEITLTKPRPVLPEPAENSFNRPGGWVMSMPGDNESEDPRGPLFGGDPDLADDGTRNAVVQVAIHAYNIEKGINGEKKWHYKYPGDEGGDGGPARPIPDSLWTEAAHDAIDCSAFATLVYKEAGAPDPSNNNYNGEGNTGTQIAHALIVSNPQPADLIFYSDEGNKSFPQHVGVYIGNGEVIEIGSSNGITRIQWDYRKVVAIGSYLGGRTQ
jgi:hypothetical protein